MPRRAWAGECSGISWTAASVAGINATFSNGAALAGDLALVSQSGAVVTAVLDWAEERNLGFSAMISLGNAGDVDFGEVLDYLALDRKTRSILLYVEGIRYSRGFMSALRAAARVKPVIVVKSGRNGAGASAATSHTAALVSGDDVFSAALERAGVIRVRDLDGLFAAAAALGSGLRALGNRLAIVSNAGGLGVLATDRLGDMGRLALADRRPLLRVCHRGGGRVAGPRPRHPPHEHPHGGRAGPRAFHHVGGYPGRQPAHAGAHGVPGFPCHHEPGGSCHPAGGEAALKGGAEAGVRGSGFGGREIGKRERRKGAQGGGPSMGPAMVARQGRRLSVPIVFAVAAITPMAPKITITMMIAVAAVAAVAAVVAGAVVGAGADDDDLGAAGAMVAFVVFVVPPAVVVLPGVVVAIMVVAFGAVVVADIQPEFGPRLGRGQQEYAEDGDGDEMAGLGLHGVHLQGLDDGRVFDLGGIIPWW